MFGPQAADGVGVDQAGALDLYICVPVAGLLDSDIAVFQRPSRTASTFFVKDLESKLELMWVFIYI